MRRDPGRDELHALTARLFRTQEDERRCVARKLHDDVGQELALLEIEIERLRQSLPADAESVREQLESVRDRAAALSADVRTLSHELHPSTLDHLGLAASLKALVEEFGEREGLAATFRHSSVSNKLPAGISITLYRVAQEALRNIAKHAGRTNVKVLLESTGEGLRFTVRDLGEGFDAGGPARRGLGLISMEERVRLFGGSLTVESALGEGTAVTVTIPLASQSKD